MCVCVCPRSVLLFRPPRLNNMFEDSVVAFTDYLTIGSLRRFIRDHLYVHPRALVSPQPALTD